MRGIGMMVSNIDCGRKRCGYNNGKGRCGYTPILDEKGRCMFRHEDALGEKWSRRRRVLSK